MKNFFIGLVIIIVIIAVIIGLVIAFSEGGLWWKNTYETAYRDVDRRIFEESKSHVKGMADDLAKYKYELAKTEDPIERKAIIDLIIDRYADFDEYNLNNLQLRKFLNDVKNGRIK